MANGHFTVDNINGLPWWNDPDGKLLAPHGFTVNASGTTANPINPYPSGGMTTQHLWKVRDRYCFGGIRLWHIQDNLRHWDDAPDDSQHAGGRGDGKGDNFYPQDTLLQVANECANQKIMCLVTLLVGGHGWFLTGQGSNNGFYQDGSGKTYKQRWQENVDSLEPAIKTNPWVTFQPIVEPGSGETANRSLWVNEHQFCIDYMRQQGFENWILPDGWWWGSDRGRPDSPWSTQQAGMVLHRNDGWGALTDPLNRLGKTLESYWWGGGPDTQWRRDQVNACLTANFNAHPNAPVVMSDWDPSGDVAWSPPRNHFEGNGTGPGSGGWSNLGAAAEAWLLEVRDNFPNVGLMSWHGNNFQGYFGGWHTTDTGPNPQGDWANINADGSNLTPIVAAWRQAALDDGTNHDDTIVDPPVDPPTRDSVHLIL